MPLVLGKKAMYPALGQKRPWYEFQHSILFWSSLKVYDLTDAVRKKMFICSAGVMMEPSQDFTTPTPHICILYIPLLPSVSVCGGGGNIISSDFASMGLWLQCLFCVEPQALGKCCGGSTVLCRCLVFVWRFCCWGVDCRLALSHLFAAPRCLQPWLLEVADAGNQLLLTHSGRFQAQKFRRTSDQPWRARRRMCRWCGLPYRLFHQECHATMEG